MGWQLIEGKAVYTFDDVLSWNPANKSKIGPWLHDCNNVRVNGPVISSRGGWEAFTAETGVITGLFGYSNSASDLLIRGLSGTLSYYDSAWVDLVSDLEIEKQYMCQISKDGDEPHLIITDGVNENLKVVPGDGSIPVELTGTVFFRGGSSEASDSWSTGTQDSTNTKRGGSGIALTTTGSGTDSDTFTVGETSTSTKFFGTSELLDEGYSSGDYTSFDEDPHDGNTTKLRHGNGAGGNEKYIAGISGTSIKSEIPEDATITGVQVYGVTEIDAGTDTFYFALRVSGTDYISSAQTTSDNWAQDDYEWTDNPVTTSTWTRDELANIQGLGVRHNQHPLYDFRVTQLYLVVNYYETDVDISGYDHATTGIGDELVFEFYVDTAANLTLAPGEPDGTNTCSIRFTSTRGPTYYCEYNLSDLNVDTAIGDGWNTLVFNQNHADRYEGSGPWDDASDWDTLESITLYLVSDDTVATSWDYAYIRKTSVFDTTNGSQERPPLAKYCFVSPHGDRLILANTKITKGKKTGPTYVWYSGAYDIDTFSNLNYVAFPTSITGGISHGGITHVLTEKEHYVMKPNYAMSDWTGNSNALDWQIAKVDDYGCVSSRTIVSGSLGEHTGIFYVSSNGIRFASGLQSVDITGPVSVLFEERQTGDDFYNDSVTHATLVDSCATLLDGEYMLAYRGLSSSANDKMLILNTTSGAYVSDTLSSTVNPTILAVSRDSGKRMQVYSGDPSGDIYQYDSSRAVYADNLVAYQSDFQTEYIGAELLSDVQWEAINLWVRSSEVAASSIIVEVYKVEDYDENTDYTEWQEELGTAFMTVTRAWTPNASSNFKWHRLRIPLLDTDNNLYPRARMISIKIYDDNDKSVDYMLESIVCVRLQGELL